jgi:hypothetical protein
MHHDKNTSIKFVAEFVGEERGALQYAYELLSKNVSSQKRDPQLLFLGVGGAYLRVRCRHLSHLLFESFERLSLAVANRQE